MMNSLGARAIVPVVIAVTGFVVMCCILLYSVIRTDMTADAERHSEHLASTIIKSTRYAMLRTDRESVQNIIDNIGSQQGVEHARIFNREGLVLFSEEHGEIDHVLDVAVSGCNDCHAGAAATAAPLTSARARRFVNGSGVEVLAITLPIYNEPACSTASCHVHPAEQKVLGMLDLGLDMAPLKHSLAIMRNRMWVFSLMVLILTVGGVSALLRRTVFIPIRLLTIFTNHAADGNLGVDFPPISGELADLGRNIHRIALKCGSVAGKTTPVEELEGLQTVEAGIASARQAAGSCLDGCTAREQRAEDGNDPTAASREGLGGSSPPADKGENP